MPILRRPSPLHSDAYQALCAVVSEARRDAGVTQRALAARIGKSASHVCMIEAGQRRVDAFEFYLIAKALDLPPAALFASVVERLEAPQGA